MRDRMWKLDFILKARENVRAAKATLPNVGAVIEEYDDWTLGRYSMMPFLVAQQLAFEAVELLLKVLLHEGSGEVDIGHRIDKGYESLPTSYRTTVDELLQEAIEASSQGELPYGITNAVSVQSRGPATGVEEEDYAAGPEQFVRYMAREWSATQSQYIGLNRDLTSGGQNVRTNGRAVAGSLVFGEKLADWCIRELFPETVRRRREGTMYTVTHYRTDGKSIVEIAQWSDRKEAEAATEDRQGEIGGGAATSYCESDENMLDNVLLAVGRSFDIRPSKVMEKISGNRRALKEP